MDPQYLGQELTGFVSGLALWAADALPNLVGALLMLLIGWWFAGWVERTIERVLKNHTRIDATLHEIMGTVARYTILVVVAIAVLGQLGIQTTSLLAAVGAIGLAIGLALQGTLSNIAAGMMLLWLRPFKAGDYIDAGGIAGTVDSVGLFSSQMRTWDGVYLFVPNSELWNTRLINYTRLPTRWVSLEFGIGYEDDVTKAREILMQLATDDERVNQEPAPITFVNELGDSAVIVVLRAWVATANYWPVRRDLTERGKIALEAAGLTIPFPQRDVHHYGTAQDQAPPADRQGAARA